LVELHGNNEAVADALDKFGYRSLVLGSHTTVQQAPWDAHVVAYPRSATRVAALASQLTEPAIPS
jgi:hypothetical protein